MAFRRIVGLFLFLCLIASSALGTEPGARTFSLDFSLQTIRAERRLLADEVYDLLKMEGLELTKVPGHPCLPAKAVSIYIPRGSRISRITVEPVRKRELPGKYLILPAQHEIPLSSDFTAEPVLPDESVYALSSAYPASPGRATASGHIAGRSITSLQVFPLQYLPAEKKIILNEEIRVDVEFAASDLGVDIPLETESVRDLRNRIVKGMVQNAGDVDADFPESAGTLDPSAATEYLIICLEQHMEKYEVLKKWKTRKGIPAAIVTTQEVFETYPGRDDPEKLRNCIMDYYLNQSTVWVLMTLSAPRAQIRGCYCSVGETVDTGIPCDLYFADMDGDWNQDGDSYWGETGDDVDLYPDVYVGRIPANKGYACSTAVRKILTYEGCYSLPTDYQLEMLFLAEYADEITDGAVAKNMIDNESVPSRFDPITKLYESSGNLNWTSAMNALNAGMGIINHDGHGNAQVLSIGPSALDSDDMMALTNAPRYSVFYTLACTPGNFGNIMGCFGRSFVESPAGGGFFVGNSRYGWYWPGNPGYGTGERFDREFFQSMFVRGFSNLGVVHADAKVQRIPWSGSNGTDRWTQFTCNLFGDPETPLWLDTPIAMSASHPEELEAGNHSFPVTVYADGSPLEQVRVCLWMGDNLYLVEETNSSGIAQFEISPTDTGSILVTATKTGYLPYLGSIDISADLSAIAVGEHPGQTPGIRVRPNPVTGTALITYCLPKHGSAAVDGHTDIKIYDAAGRLVKTVATPESNSPISAVPWDGRLAGGVEAPSGIYFVKVSHGRLSTTAKFVILR